MATNKQWLGLDDALEGLLNEEYYSECESEDETSLPGSDLEVEKIDDTQSDREEADILNRISAGNILTAANQQPTAASKKPVYSTSCSADNIANFIPEDNSDELKTKLTAEMLIECCPEKCWESFTLSDIYTHILSLRELQKSEREMYIMGKLTVCSSDPDSTQHARKKRKGDLLNWFLFNPN